ncbi:MAG: DUF1573 domain-containing protein [Candidatus Cyclobacteriaceae bacterium M2_1C_046]
MRIFSLAILFNFFLFIASAQQADILKFEEQIYDFGIVKEADGPVLHEFVFTNTGAEPIKITNVKTSCGCTTPGWTKEAVAPGEQGFVQAQYDTYNRPGSFNKSLTVFTDDGKQVALFIRGNVSPRPKSIEEELPYTDGNLRTKYRSFNMGKVLTTDDPTLKDFDIYNAGEQPLIIKSIIHPEHVQVNLADTINAGESATLTISYAAKKKGDLGFFTENMTLVTNEPIDSIKSYTLFTNIEEYFAPMSKEEFEKSARLSFGEQIYDFDRAKEGEKVKNEFQLTNNGQSVLNIRKVDSNCTCLKAELSKNNLAPGESAIIKTEFDSSGRKGNQQKAITVYSNDPSAPVQRLTVKGYVEANN